MKRRRQYFSNKGPSIGGVIGFPIIAISFFGMGLLFFFLIGQISTLGCEREADQQVNCTLSTSWMNLYPLSERSVPNLQGAQVEPDCSDDGCTYRVLLTTSRTSVPMNDLYTSDERGLSALAERINAYLDDPSQRSLEVENGGGFLIIFPLVFMTVGGVFAFLGSRSIFR